MEGYKYCEGIDECVLLKHIASQSKNGAFANEVGFGSGGKFWTENGWNSFKQRCATIANTEGCLQQDLVNQLIQQETARKANESEFI